MKIAVIGGGASGLVSAWLLDKVHEVHVFERQSIPGGNVRTLGGNVRCPGLEEGVISENGVSWFLSSTYPNTHRLLYALGMPQTSRLLDSSIVLNDGQHCHVSALDGLSQFPWEASVSELMHLGEAALEIFQAIGKVGSMTQTEASSAPLDPILRDLSHLVAQWLRGVVAGAFSVPFGEVGQFPAAMVLPLMRVFLQDRRCTVLQGGVYSYLQQILNQFTGTLHTSACVESVRRHRGAVSVTVSGTTENFDRVVLATTPECALRMLADPTPEETQWLRLWQDCNLRTVAHVSEAIYENRHVPFRTPGDCFERLEDGVVGYNCCLNDLYGIRSNRRYSFCSQLEQYLAPEDILDIQQHVTPLYNVRAAAHRDEIRRINGQNGTCYAGAWLFDGLHEGAITSAVEVARILGGRTIESISQTGPDSTS